VQVAGGGRGRAGGDGGQGASLDSFLSFFEHGIDVVIDQVLLCTAQGRGRESPVECSLPSSTEVCIGGYRNNESSYTSNMAAV